MEKKVCVRCGEEYTRNSRESYSDFKNRKFCSKNCYSAFHRGENHHNYKGGIKHRPDGYLRNSATDQYLHREVMEKVLGRPLETWEHVHHIDGNKGNNDPSNLMVLTNNEHRILENRIASRDEKGRYIHA